MTQIRAVEDAVRVQGWTADEFELLHNSARFLLSVGVNVETAWGLTDEGEPWYLFCDAESGDILGHFARLNDEYIACVPFCDAGQSDRELSHLMRRFFKTARLSVGSPGA